MTGTYYKTLRGIPVFVRCRSDVGRIGIGLPLFTACLFLQTGIEDDPGENDGAACDL